MNAARISLAALLAGLSATGLLLGLPAPPDAPLERPDQDRIADLEKQIATLQEELAAARRANPEDLAAETSVKPGINTSWKSDNIRPLIQRLEAESREIFTECDTIAALVGARRGMTVADVGAGSGFMAQLLAEMVGPDGKVYAVDINATLMERLGRAAEAEGLSNLETVVCSEKSVELPANSVDIVFVCDTYHHFEYPRNSLASIHRALRSGGQLVVIDFHRIPGVSREFIMGHVRAGEEVFTREILDAGFELTNTHYMPQLKENYALRFRKK